MFLFLFFSMLPTMLIFQIKRIISSEKWCNYVVTFFFFSENAKNLVGRTKVNGLRSTVKLTYDQNDF